MRRVTRVIAALILAIIWLLPMSVSAATAKPDLVISQYKITSSNGQFFMLYNASTNAIDMKSVVLTYFNNYNLASATSSKTISLEGTLPPGGYYLLNDGPLTLCYQMLVNSVSLGFSSTAGSVQLQRLTQTTPGGPITSVLQDFLSWSKSSVTGVQQLPSDTNKSLLRQPTDQNNNPSVSTPGQGSWIDVQPDANNPCVLTSTHISAPPVIPTSLLLLSSTPPPVTIVSIAAEPSGPYLPSSDIGLMAPVINEVLPNPKTPQTDADHEFIELYNPNDKEFDLSGGFKLQVGTTTKKTYTIPVGLKLPPKSFTPFYSAVTKLALSNSGGQAVLLDPFGNSISKTKEYPSAKDGQAWALANNDWYWTLKPTPGEANIIDNSSVSQANKSNTADPTRVQGASTSSSGASSAEQAEQKVANLHPGTLATVGTLALAYGAYEYRQDAVNHYRRFRSNRAAGQKVK